MKANMSTILISIGLVVIPYLLTQPDVAIPQWAKLVLTAGNLALGVIARYLPSPEDPPTKVEITGAVPTVETPTEE